MYRVFLWAAVLLPNGGFTCCVLQSLLFLHRSGLNLWIPPPPPPLRNKIWRKCREKRTILLLVKSFEVNFQRERRLCLLGFKRWRFSSTELNWEKESIEFKNLKIISWPYIKCFLSWPFIDFKQELLFILFLVK